MFYRFNRFDGFDYFVFLPLVMGFRFLLVLVGSVVLVVWMPFQVVFVLMVEWF